MLGGDEAWGAGQVLGKAALGRATRPRALLCHLGADAYTVPSWGAGPLWAVSVAALVAVCLAYLVWAIGATFYGAFCTALVAGGRAII